MNTTQEQIYGILEKVHLFCVENGIDYFINYGTLIGAVRHKGFIPWDDDIDIVMKRAELYRFEKLYLKSDYQAEGLKLQSRRVYKYKAEDTARIRDTNVQLREIQSSTQEGNLGPWIDIFGYDNIPDDKELRYKQMDKILRYNKLLKFFLLVKVVDSDRGAKKQIKSIIQFLNEKFYRFNPIIPILFKKRYNVVTMYNDIDTKYCGELSYLHYTKYEEFELAYIENAKFYDITDIEFEGSMFKAPVDSDGILTRQYGDYMTIPNEEDWKIHSLESI